MKKKLMLVLIALYHFCASFSQGKVLTGVITMVGRPVIGVTVYTSFTTATTDNFGRYAIDLSGCTTCKPGDRLTIFTFHQDIGSSEQVCTISNDYKFNFSVVKISNKYMISGIVKTSGTDGVPLSDIDVKVMGIEYEMEAVRTNRFGEFRILIPKEVIPTGQNAILLQASDPQKKYKPIRLDPELFNINAFNVIQMQPGHSDIIWVKGYTPSKVCVKAGDAVSIEASGQIRIGSFAGSSDPDGRTAGVFGMALEQYNIVRSFNHAALMYRFSGESEWKVAGKKKKFIVPSSISNGCIEFQVNDNMQGDNSGSYEVEVSVQSN